MSFAPARTLDPHRKYCTFCRAVIPAGANSCPRCGEQQATRSRSAIVLLALLLVGVVIASVASPIFVRYRLKAKIAEVGRTLDALDTAEQAVFADDDEYLALPDGLPSAPMSREPAGLSPDDLALARGIGWDPGTAGTYGRYRVAVAKDRAGNEALSMCAELDGDGDGRHAVLILFRPALNAQGAVVLAPPPAPCTERAVIAEGASLEFQEWMPSGVQLRMSPDDVF